MFAIYKKHNNNFYNKLVELSRNIFFYNDLQLKDNFDTRIILIFLHLSIILRLFTNKNKKKFPQDIYDNIFLNIEYNLREEGFGDVAVNKKMKILNRIFYDILIKIDGKTSNNLKINKDILKLYLFEKEFPLNSEFIDKLIKYLLSFHNFCFELEDDIMLKGKINFKY